LIRCKHMLWTWKKNHNVCSQPTSEYGTAGVVLGGVQFETALNKSSNTG
jgi:hypothetical protein